MLSFTPSDYSAILLSLKVAVTATLLSLPFGFAAAYLMTYRKFRGRILLDVFVNLPLTLPPVVVGYLLLLLLGRNGWIGRMLLQPLGINLIFTWRAAVIATAVVGFPLMVRSIRTGMETIDERLIQASRTLGAGLWDSILTIIVPLSMRGIIAGSLLMFARGLGEFGATIIVAGNIPGVTQTIPLAIYEYVSSPGGTPWQWPSASSPLPSPLWSFSFMSGSAGAWSGQIDMELRVSLQKEYGTFFLDADFALRGEWIGIFGPSGSGKSTLVSLIAGLHHPDSGLIVLDGETLFDSRHRLDVHAERRRISMVFQRPHLFPHLSVKGNLLYGYKRCAPLHRKVTLDSVVEVLGIDNLLDRGVKNLSGGEKQRVAIGRAVLSNPRLLVMDEPLSALDDALKFQIIPFLKNACRIFEIPYLFISHSLLEMRIMTDQLLNIVDGRIAEQTTAEAFARARMGESPGGYTNLLRVTAPRRIDSFYGYRWGDRELFVSAGSDAPEALFELSSTDIILFKRHPEATSARNLLKCTVVDVFETGTRIGVELECAGERLIAQVVSQAVRELQLTKGSEVYAAIKAVAFSKLT